jgi:hypothetical protein
MNSLEKCFSHFFACGLFWLQKLNKDPPIPADVNIGFPDDRFLKLKIYLLELILDRYEWKPVAYVLRNLMLLP